ncbi:XRE family transcriptional regulator [Streptomyces sp. NPDC090025]|uniref:helix-turn-helix domain-containing protein n=1 Tax=Streptomyces sp. NPDC090025 TaxID=3365922 RepID=UPI00383931AA
MRRADHDRRALKEFLQERRAAIAPQSVGFPAPSGRGRRAAGVSQEQLDQLLCRAPGTYNRLENGQMPNPAGELLSRLAWLLRMNEQDWAILWRLTRREHPPYTLHRDSGLALPGVWRGVVEAVSGVMAYVNDAEWNVLAVNAEFRALFPRCEPPANTMRWMLLDPEARTAILTDWATRWAPVVMPQLRHAVELRPDNTALAGIERDVLADPVAGPLYREFTATPVPYPDGSERPIHHAVLGPGWIATCVSEPVTSPGARVMLLTFTPGAPLVERRPLLQAPLRS